MFYTVWKMHLSAANRANLAFGGFALRPPTGSGARPLDPLGNSIPRPPVPTLPQNLGYATYFVQ